jgi:hypothetical protein
MISGVHDRRKPESGEKNGGHQEEKSRYALNIKNPAQAVPIVPPYLSQQ